MTSFLVESYTPAQSAIADLQKQARTAAEELAAGGRPVRYLRSIFIPGDETCFHLFEGHSADIVREASVKAGFSPLRIVEALP